ncbi:MAG: HlyD family efflux transporter periplasmic adaptor subunit [Ignavibacteria bacterium]|nr:HlyD family efflux transporter periplasmic adaptor subunit [Ignavibacteria bacterium]
MVTEINKNKAQLLILMAFTAFMFNACSNGSAENEADGKASTPVTITHVSFEPMAEYVELSANSAFRKKSIVRSSITGMVLSVAVNPGDKVARGQTLFTLITREAAALMDKKAQGDSSLHFNGELKVRAAQNGIVSSIAHQQGDYVQEGDELASVAEPASLVFNLQAPYELTGYIHTGEPCEIILPNQINFQGKIETMLPAMDMQAQTLTLVVKPLMAEDIPENLIAKIKIVKSLKKNACTLPKEAVLTDETQTLFWVMKLLNDSVAVKTIIHKGIESDDKIEVLKPIFTTADRIIATGNYGLEDTAKVTITTK